MFLSFGASISGAASCPTGFAVADGCFLKGKYLGTLLALILMDPLGGQFPLAFAVVGNEDCESWEYFFEKVKSLGVPGVLESGFSLMGDQDKGMQAALKKSFAEVVRLKCTKHMERNIDRFGKKMKQMFRKAASAPPCSLDTVMEDIKDENEEFFAYLSKKDRKTWAKGAVCSRRYTHTTNNMSEGFNSVIGGARKKEVLGMLDTILGKLRQWHFDRKGSAVGAAGADTDVIGYIRDKVQLAMMEGGTFLVEPVMEDADSEVFEGLFLNF
eukprot:TRINITY_DN1321_c0_g1_i6.p1 TRINITY_DN1321_c0_g1~~TRINITY_DN1321_c0_g1_i6.p1  ORF type:complete len:270 (-),score=40.98 TRINITY_DN1321_c0_g1_i6:150-959(-)